MHRVNIALKTVNYGLINWDVILYYLLKTPYIKFIQ